MTSAVAVFVHVLGALAIVAAGLLWDDGLPQREVQAFFAAPLTLAQPPPPPPPAAARPAPRPVAVRPQQSQLVAPVSVPSTIAPEPSLDLGSSGGLPGGVEGGVPGGVVGGVIGGLPDAPPPPPRRTLRAGVDVREPHKVRDAAPVYPDLAVMSHLQGVVILDCTIDTHGRVSDVRVLRGVPTLNEAAVAAVRQWVYTPTLVNGVPVPVVLTVTVGFHLQDATGGR